MATIIGVVASADRLDASPAMACRPQSTVFGQTAVNLLGMHVDPMTFWTAVGALAAVVAAIVAVVSALSSRKSNRTTGAMQENLTAAIQQIAETGAPTIAFGVERSSTALASWTGYVLRNIGKEKVQIVEIKPGGRGNIRVDGLPVTLEPGQEHPFALLMQGSIIWGTTHTIAVTVTGKEQPFFVSIPQ